MEKYLREFPISVQDKWKELLNDNQTGIQRLRNKFVNGLVPRDVQYKIKLKPKSQEYKRIIQKVLTHFDTKTNVGMGKTAFIGSICAGNKALFDEGFSYITNCINTNTENKDVKQFVCSIFHVINYSKYKHIFQSIMFPKTACN